MKGHSILRGFVLWFFTAGLIIPAGLLAQNAPPTFDSAYAKVLATRGIERDTTYVNVASGEFTPGKGFDIVRTNFGRLNISLYAMARYLNQMPGSQTYLDHLGRENQVVARNDIYWHRVMIWFSGWLGTPKLKYNAAVWTIFTTQQTLVYGQIQYDLDKHIKFNVGVGPNLCVRSMQGPFPFYSSTDRTMEEDALRGGFTNGFWITGEVVPRLNYTVMIGNNLSTLGIQAGALTRNMSKSISLWWQPTTGEFGPRGGIGDLEEHQRVATRFGFSYCHSREDRFNNIGEPAPDNTQVRMTDGVLFFQTGALADGVTVDNANYDMGSVDLGVKYKGLGVQLELYGRQLSKFAADGPLPVSTLTDYAYSLQVSQVVVKRKLIAYAINGYFWDSFNRHPWEAGGGVNWYPYKTRSWRLNAQVMYVYKTAAGGTFGLYTAGQTGTTITVGTDILL
ncbi:MAG TPA: hypothetical protein VMI35_12860 [Puia sp.]|nr:hypothetical protein [Puia sp.]